MGQVHHPRDLRVPCVLPALDVSIATISILARRSGRLQRRAVATLRWQRPLHLGHTKTGDKIAFTVEDNEVRLRRTGSVVATTAGILKSHERPLTAEELRAAAEKAMAEEAMERSR
jgi:hypothetical protein